MPEVDALLRSGVLTEGQVQAAFPPQGAHMEPCLLGKCDSPGSLNPTFQARIPDTWEAGVSTGKSPGPAAAGTGSLHRTRAPGRQRGAVHAAGAVRSQAEDTGLSNKTHAARPRSYTAEEVIRGGQLAPTFIMKGL